ncbi:MAG TPA: hypothetical protein VN114_13205 [Oxalicibacterium sp.]|uniref:VOC family protein n=1 Tax=Oxalicibacterium sp. TaxID=2766525 RepID=UPI002CB66C39|nr:hypothetical protein [Oxalicibacterium sp.]HWU99465.1 hypothetical protein [Oxalicibacterium sp.]
MDAQINWLEIPTTDPRLAIRIYETIFHTRLRIEHSAPGPRTALCSDAILAHVESAWENAGGNNPELPNSTGFITRFTDTEGNLVALHAHD